MKARAMGTKGILAFSLILAGCGPVAKAVTKVAAGSGDDAAKAAGVGAGAHAGAAVDDASAVGREVVEQGAQQGVQYATSPADNRTAGK